MPHTLFNISKARINQIIQEELDRAITRRKIEAIYDIEEDKKLTQAEWDILIVEAVNILNVNYRSGAPAEKTSSALRKLQDTHERRRQTAEILKKVADVDKQSVIAEQDDAKEKSSSEKTSDSYTWQDLTSKDGGNKYAYRYDLSTGDIFIVKDRNGKDVNKKVKKETAAYNAIYKQYTQYVADNKKSEEAQVQPTPEQEKTTAEVEKQLDDAWGGWIRDASIAVSNAITSGEDVSKVNAAETEFQELIVKLVNRNKKLLAQRTNKRFDDFSKNFDDDKADTFEFSPRASTQKDAVDDAADSKAATTESRWLRLAGLLKG